MEFSLLLTLASPMCQRGSVQMDCLWKRLEGKEGRGKMAEGKQEGSRAKEWWPRGQADDTPGCVSCTVSTGFHSWPEKTFAGA